MKKLICCLLLLHLVGCTSNKKVIVAEPLFRIIKSNEGQGGTFKFYETITENSDARHVRYGAEKTYYSIHVYTLDPQGFMNSTYLEKKFYFGHPGKIIGYGILKSINLVKWHFGNIIF